MENSEISEKEAALIQRETSAAQREKQVHADRQAIEAEKAKLTEREKAIIIAEQKRDAGFADEHPVADVSQQGNADLLPDGLARIFRRIAKRMYWRRT